ncbi:type II secretion system GspH family protein [Candidatus Peribacteria bacterium]|nr:MAG: type II secretion system GspH family protein [Candidatus Peribacteria bacterium]
MHPSLCHRRAGFTLLELLVVIGIIGALASIVVAALSPTRQLASSRDAKRQSDVNAILNAVYQYTIDHKGILPGGIPQGDTPRGICTVTATSCNNGVNLRILSGSYLVAIPIDPRAPENGTGTMYFIHQNTNSRLTVTAPLAEEKSIVVTR